MKWTKEEEQFLIDNYAKGAAYCAEKLGRTKSAIIQKALRLGITKTNWTKKEEQFLIDNYAKGAAYCAEQLGRTHESIKKKANRLNLTKTMKWTKKEIQFLTDNYAEHGITYCAEQLGRTYRAVNIKASKLNLTKSIIKFDWTEEEEQFLIDKYAEQGPTYCAKHLNRTYGAIIQRAASLGLQANTKYDSNIVYAVYFTDLFLYKVGITNNIERRLKQFGHPCVILNAKEYDTPQEAAQVERDLLNSVTRINTGELLNGNTETFTQPSEKIKEFLGEQFADL